MARQPCRVYNVKRVVIVTGVALMRRLTIIAILVASTCLATPASDVRFDDPVFRRCISWMLDGYRGALLQNICTDEYDLPQPSLFLCARKIRTGFS
jgi:hypothetical protein